jgi:hypothetical protein
MAKRPTTTISHIHPRGGALALLSALALSATAAAPASATAPAPVSSRPATFALSPVGGDSSLLLRGIPGRVLDGAVRVRNLTGHAITVNLQSAQIENASNGNADYITAGLSAAGRWLRIGASSVRLSPGQQRQVAFEVSVPAAAHDASYYDGIVAIDAAELVAVSARKRTRGESLSFSRINRQALPLTIRLPGKLTRGLSLRSVAITVQPAGAGLVLGLLSQGSELIQDAPIELRVLRGTHAVFSYSSTLGQLFPGVILSYRIPWQGRPTTGAYSVIGAIHPKDAAIVHIDQTVQFTAATAARLQHVTPQPTQPAKSAMPIWVWLALAVGASLLLGLSLTVWKLARRPTTVIVR